MGDKNAFDLGSVPVPKEEEGTVDWPEPSSSPAQQQPNQKRVRRKKSTGQGFSLLQLHSILERDCKWICLAFFMGWIASGISHWL
jgi:hypothetical protein